MVLNAYALQLALQGGFQGNYYKIYINPSNPSLNLGFFEWTKFETLAKGVSLPEKSISTSEYSYQGMKLNVRDKVETAQTFTITFYDDSVLALRIYFETWMEKIRSYNDIEIEDYKAEIKIEPRIKKGIVATVYNVDREYKFVGAYPTSMTGMGLDSTVQEGLTEFTVTFTYQHIDYNTDTEIFGISI